MPTALPLAPVAPPLGAPPAPIEEEESAAGLPPSPIIGRRRRTWVLLRLWAHVVRVALQTYRNPVRAVTALRRARHASRTLDVQARKIAQVSGRSFPHLYVPGWPSPAFDRFVGRELNAVLPLGDAGQPAATLQTAIVAMTRRCALRCEHCFEWDALDRHEALSVNELKNIALELRRAGATQLFLSGGEPLQRFNDLVDLISSAAADTDVWILTSGRGLTPDRARRLRQAGLTGVSISLDHWDPASHDAFRGVPGTFRAAESAAAAARGAGLVLALALCPTRTFATPDNLRRYASASRALGAAFIHVFEPKPVGHYADRDVLLTPAHHRIVADFIAWLNTSDDAHDFPAGVHVDGVARRVGCRGAGDRYAYVDTEGVLHPCPFCRAPGARLLDTDVHQALASLRQTGCPAGNCCAAPDSSCKETSR